MLKLTNKNAKDIQQTLHKDYHSSSTRILRSYFMAVYYVVIESIFYADGFSDIKDLFVHILIIRDSQGVYSSKAKTSYVFMFNIKDEDENVRHMCGVWTLIHELRHHYQHTKKPKLLDIAEKDAERFSFRMIDKNYALYKEILRLEIHK